VFENKQYMHFHVLSDSRKFTKKKQAD